MSDLVVTHAAKSYPTPSGPLEVLKDADFSMRRGESLAIVGPSGSGKSTLLALLGGLEPPTSGTITIAGQDPYSLPEQVLPKFRGEQFGFVFQEHYLLPQCTVLENVLTPHLAIGSAGKPEQDAARELLSRVGLAERLTHLPRELSGGERQRVAIARALVRRPTLVLADEPTGNLDQTTAGQVTELLLELQRETDSVLVVVTHSAELAAAMQHSKRLDDGRLVDQ
ncbi:Lipoprotein-releasing system ATP-binding protein LolD [Posidoniimonas corsicana]|uniref:Lipoprotein-releasing system ATP-binding protein LolD n=1 Tax=Posidoniimonas corsicana TaxID=1938618 RepID=A0A5C5UX42_9BACT|nr:ABC transporter ATP-binding protein [Posidoniimonas corsicana]TWT30203.1 Lipoprotein-releasing system ATP-binding protein LolD [Posidoniimonas corsicana]